jgi:arsenate reductase
MFSGSRCEFNGRATPWAAHWGVSDPAAAEGSEAEKRAAFENAYRKLEKRISIFVNLPLEHLEGPELKKELTRIGQLDDADA